MAKQLDNRCLISLFFVKSSQRKKEVFRLIRNEIFVKMCRMGPMMTMADNETIIFLFLFLSSIHRYQKCRIRFYIWL